MKRFTMGLLLLAALLAACGGAKGPSTPEKGAVKQRQWSAPPPLTIDLNKRYSATMKTSEGQITFDLFAKETPQAVNNFVFLARAGFYDGVTFHRIVKGFMVQGGDPIGTGTGGPGYRFNDEPVKRDYLRGTLAMANAGPNTNGSQFFIMHQNYPLPKNYVIFGRATAGLDVVDKIAETPVVDSGRGELSKPTRSVTISRITIREE